MIGVGEDDYDDDGFWSLNVIHLFFSSVPFLTPFFPLIPFSFLLPSYLRYLSYLYLYPYSYSNLYFYLYPYPRCFVASSIRVRVKIRKERKESTRKEIRNSKFPGRRAMGKDEKGRGKRGGMGIIEGGREEKGEHIPPILPVFFSFFSSKK